MRWAALALILAGCALTTEFIMKCDGPCSIEVERSIKKEVP